MFDGLRTQWQLIFGDNNCYDDGMTQLTTAIIVIATWWQRLWLCYQMYVLRWQWTRRDRQWVRVVRPPLDVQSLDHRPLPSRGASHGESSAQIIRYDKCQKFTFPWFDCSELIMNWVMIKLHFIKCDCCLFVFKSVRSAWVLAKISL